MAAQFSDDAYNKFLAPEQNRAGTLIGNWSEERAIRDATGEGRSIPQRHIPRRDLLKDWTKTAPGGGRKQDNTFERTYGPKCFYLNVPTSKVIGAGEADITGEVPIAHIVQAEGRIPRVGARELACKAARWETAELELKAEEAERERLANLRSFDTTAGMEYQKPDESLAEKAAHLRKSCKLEILHGPHPERSIALRNAGMDIQTNVHYSNTEGVTHARMSLMEPFMRNDMKVSACQGFRTFGKNSEFSKPIGECMLGIAKDDELTKLYQAEKTTNPMKTGYSVVPTSLPHRGVPSLAAVKDKIHTQISQTWGQYGYVSLRHQLYDCSDHEGFVNKNDVIALFRNSLTLSQEAVTDEELEVWLSQLITMRKTDLRINTLMTSLRPALQNAAKKRIQEVFAAMEPSADGVVRLGSWLTTIQDAELRGVLANAFGAEEESAVADVPLTEVTLLELLADLNPLINIMALLQ
jgi:hypothetical protein